MELRSRVATVAGASVLAAVGLVGYQLASSTSSATSTFPPAPANLRAYEVGQTYAKVSYGPSIVGPFTHDVPAPDGRSMIVRWGGARDDLYPLGITYSYYKNGQLVWAGRSQTYAKVGFSLSVRSFTTCVVAHSQSGFGPKRCTTWTGR